MSNLGAFVALAQGELKSYFDRVRSRGVGHD
jgi:hypothetical protein